MTLPLFKLITALLTMLLVPMASAQTEAPVARTTEGMVQGYENEEGVLVFKGIPYAADTGGKNRFLPPQSRKPWTSTLDATKFGAKCPQTGNGNPFDPAEPRNVNEDCLFVNVWTSKLSGQRPVFVYFHGGA